MGEKLKFELWKCPDKDCGCVAVTPEEQPKCDDCGKNMVVITDKDERTEANRVLKAHIRRVVEGV